MTETPAPATLAAALGKLQASLPAIHKDQTANAGNYSYAYADLAQISKAVLPMLAPLGLAWISKPTVNADGKFVLAYALLHISGERESGEYPLNPAGTAQQRGSEISYARRYALCSVLGVAPEADDDGAAASAGQPAKRAAPRKAAPSTKDTPEKTALDGPMSDITRKALHASLNDAGIRDRQGKLDFAAEVLHIQEFDSTTQLTERQARMVISAAREGLTDDHREDPDAG